MSSSSVSSPSAGPVSDKPVPPLDKEDLCVGGSLLVSMLVVPVIVTLGLFYWPGVGLSHYGPVTVLNFLELATYVAGATALPTGLIFLGAWKCKELYFDKHAPGGVDLPK